MIKLGRCSLIGLILFSSLVIFGCEKKQPTVAKKKAENRELSNPELLVNGM